jgi:hypothetical protein
LDGYRLQPEYVDLPVRLHTDYHDHVVSTVHSASSA